MKISVWNDGSFRIEYSTGGTVYYTRSLTREPVVIEINHPDKLTKNDAKRISG